MKIMIDFDGVIHSFESGYTGVVPEDKPVLGAKDFIDFVIELGHEVVVFTSRANPYKRDPYNSIVSVRKWLDDHGFPKIRITGVKEPADLYIDDRGYRFTGHFGELRDWIRKGNIQPYHKREVF